jgi:hypothetical protein
MSPALTVGVSYFFLGRKLIFLMHLGTEPVEYFPPIFITPAYFSFYFFLNIFFSLFPINMSPLHMNSGKLSKYPPREYVDCRKHPTFL